MCGKYQYTGFIFTVLCLGSCQLSLSCADENIHLEDALAELDFQCIIHNKFIFIPGACEDDLSVYGVLSVTY